MLQLLCQLAVHSAKARLLAAVLLILLPVMVLLPVSLVGLLLLLLLHVSMKRMSLPITLQ
jgi:hypothetical protein